MIAGRFMTIKPSVSISNNTLLHRSSNRTNFKSGFLAVQQSRSLSFQYTRANTTSLSLQCRCTKKEKLAETKTIGDDFGLWKLFFRDLQTQWFNSMLYPLRPVNDALSAISLLHLKSHKIEPMNVSFNELMGVDDIITEFQNITSILHGKGERKNFSAMLPNGVLLHGPPGAGKGTLVHAMAREAKVPFFRVSACYIATGEVRIKSLFDEARRCSPSIVFIENVDEIARQQENCDSDSYLIELQTEMEKCNKDGSLVVVVAATHSLETLDPAFMSSYRFQKTFHVAKPEEDSKRKKADLYFKDYILDEDKEAICNLIASQTPGSVWANLKDIVAESRCSARWRGGDRVTMDDVRRAVRRFNTDGRCEADEPVAQEPMRLIVGSQN